MISKGTFFEKLKNGISFKRLYRFFLPKESSDSGKLFGKAGEKRAVRFLRKNGYKILCTNYRSKTGEIDIIARDDDCIVFVEVKARRSFKAGSAFDSVDKKKQRKISMVALSYLKQERKLDQKARFDVIGITKNGKKTDIKLLKNAFELSYR